MNKILFIEIKDNKAITSLSTHDGTKHHLLYQKSSSFKPVFGSIIFDSTWIKTIKKEITDKFQLLNIDKIYIMVNKTSTLTKSEVINIPTNTYLPAAIKDLKTKIYSAYNNLVVIDADVNVITKETTQSTIVVTHEAIAKKLHQQIVGAFIANKLVDYQFISTFQAKKMALNNYSTNKSIVNIAIETNHIAISFLEDGNYKSIIKIKNGLNLIYQNIVNKMNIKPSLAKKMYQAFGHIPPDKVIDNKIIYSSVNNQGRITIFTKKDLSFYITEVVNLLFSQIQNELNKINDSEPLLIFSGEILNLVGFEEYAQITLGTKKSIHSFATSIIGITKENALITIGVLDFLTKDIIINVSNNISQNDNYLLKNEFGYFKRLISKFNRTYNYL